MYFQDTYQTNAIAYINNGTCKSVTKGSCGYNSSYSYYSSFTYNGYNVVITSGLPGYPTSDDSTKSNGNTRCQYWKFLKFSSSPTKTSTLTYVMSTTGYAVSGGHFYNELSSPNGSLAISYEGISLDSCYGHADSSGIYHYHKVWMIQFFGAFTLGSLRRARRRTS
jgi:hypothetical protein